MTVEENNETSDHKTEKQINIQENIYIYIYTILHIIKSLHPNFEDIMNVNRL